ncbi:MAG: hypothetical protein L6Q57_09550 [Alphaproteobacteria bacterium]|nr:hypothetical protein [Alphaproteobacteria bacterium]
MNAEIRLIKGEWVDSKRNRTIPYKIYYPQNLSEPKPLILWSHGFGGNRDGAAFLSRFLAGHGYVVVHLTHIGTDSSIWEGKPGHPWDVLRNHHVPRPVTLDRFADIPFVLDHLPGWLAENPEIGPIDFARIGMAGHSFGALSTQVAAGQLYPNHDDALISLREPRIKAGILYSPVPIDHLLKGDHPDIYSPIAIPLLHMTGTQDFAPIGGEPYETRLKIFEQSIHAPRALLIKEGGDHMIYNGTRGKLEENPLRGRHEEIIQIASLAYWDALLRHDSKAEHWLREGGLQDWLGKDARFAMTMPGSAAN